MLEICILGQVELVTNSKKLIRVPAKFDSIEEAGRIRISHSLIILLGCPAFLDRTAKNHLLR